MSKQPKTAKKQTSHPSQESLRSASSDETIAPVQKIRKKEKVEKELPELEFMSISVIYEHVQRQKLQTSKFSFKKPDKAAGTFTCFCKKTYTYRRGLKRHVSFEHKGDARVADLLDQLSKRPYKQKVDIYGRQDEKRKVKIVQKLFPKTISEKVRLFISMQKGSNCPQAKMRIQNERWRQQISRLVDGLLNNFKRVNIFLKHLSLEKLLILFLQCIVVDSQQTNFPTDSWSPIEAVLETFVSWLNKHYRRILDDLPTNSYHILLGPEQNYCSCFGTWMIQDIIERYLSRKQLPTQNYTSFFLTSFLAFMSQKDLLDMS